MSIPRWSVHLVDDAATFPPGNLPLEEAVRGHAAHRAAAYADLVGGFVVSDSLLTDLIEVLGGRAASGASGQSRPPLAVNLVVTGGAGAIGPAVVWARRSEHLQLKALEFALRDEEDLAHNAQRVVAAVDALGEELDGVEVYVEPPAIHGEPGHGWLAALDELAARELRLKFRTGGVTADAFPNESDLAACIDAALDRETAFKCTAGLHHARRHRDPETGFEHHGFLNVLLATRATLDGDDPVEVLADTDLRVRLDKSDPEALSRARKWFVSFGSCNVLEPHGDLVELGLL